MLIRRLRGLLVSIVGGALAGAAAGAVLGLIFLLMPGEITIVPQFPGAALIVPSVWGAAIGAMSGGAFGVLLMTAERGRGVDELRPYRVATWAAVASAAALRLGGASWMLVAIGSGLAAGIGAGATMLAKRGRDRAASGEIHAPQPNDRWS